MVVPPGRGQVIFHLKDAELVSQLIDGNFPDYRAIIPQSFKTHTILSTPAFLKACKQAEIIAREGNNVIRLNILPDDDGPGEVEITAQTEETGKSDIQMDATIEGSRLGDRFQRAIPARGAGCDQHAQRGAGNQRQQHARV